MKRKSPRSMQIYLKLEELVAEQWVTGISERTLVGRELLERCSLPSWSMAVILRVIIEELHINQLYYLESHMEEI